MKYNKIAAVSTDKSSDIANVYSAKIDALKSDNAQLRMELDEVKRRIASPQHVSINDVPVSSKPSVGMFTSEDVDKEVIKAVNMALSEAEEEFSKILKKSKGDKFEIVVKSGVTVSDDASVMQSEIDKLYDELDKQKSAFEEKIESLNSIIESKNELISVLKNKSIPVHNSVFKPVDRIKEERPRIDNIIIDPIDDVSLDKFDVGRMEPDIFHDPVDIKDQVDKLRTLLGGG